MTTGRAEISVINSLFDMCRAANAFATPAFQEMRHKAIAQDLSWLKPARKWEAVLEGLLTGSSEARDRGAAVRTPVQTPEHVARTEKTAALREEAKVCSGVYWCPLAGFMS